MSEDLLWGGCMRGWEVDGGGAGRGVSSPKEGEYKGESNGEALYPFLLLLLDAWLRRNAGLVSEKH